MRWGGIGATELERLLVAADATLHDALQTLENGGEAIAFVCAPDGRVAGAISDGDVRRALLAGADLQSRCLERMMTRDFAFVSPEAGRADVLDLMRSRAIGQLPVIDASGRLVGLHTVGRLLSLAERANPAVILAGGRGRRLGALADSIPKPMVSVAGRPVLERLVLHLMSFGIRTFYLSVNHLADVIESHFGDGTRFGCRISYLREEIPLGSGGPLSLLDPVPDVPVLVVNGDLVTQCDIGRMIDGHVDGGFVATVSVRSHETQLPFGVARIDGARLLELHEKPVHRVHINAGIYVLSPESLRRVPKGEQFPITDLFAAHLRDGDPVGVYVVEDEWLDIGSPEDLQRARGRDPMMVTESLT